jgi:hypothetical protein
MVGVSLRRGEGEPDSDRAKRIARLKRELVLQLFFQRGEFWHAISEARSRLGREAKTSMFPGNHGLSKVFAIDDLGWSELGEEFRSKIFEEVVQVEKRMIPHGLRDDFLMYEWADFLTLCIMCDPPASELDKFAEYGGPTWVSASGEGVKGEQTRGAAPPVRVVRDPFQAEIQRVAQIIKLLDLIDEAHPEIRVWELVKEQELLERFRSEMADVPQRFHIEVGETTTARDVGNAYRAIREIQKEQDRKGGAPTRDPLIAVQGAVLYDRYNSTDSDDGRRREWTFKKLSERFGLRSGRAAKEYVECGRELLKKVRVH